MFAEASTRLRTQAGINASAMPHALSNLLHLSLNPDTSHQELVAAVELDPNLLAHFLMQKMPSELGLWHAAFRPIHFMSIAARLAMLTRAAPPSFDEWQKDLTNWQTALTQYHLVELLAASLAYQPAHDAALSALLASSSENLVRDLPDQARDAIRFQYAPVDALRDTDPLLRMVAAATQIVQNPNMPVRQGYLEDWDLAGIDLGTAIKQAKANALDRTANQKESSAIPALRYEQDLSDLDRVLKRYEYKVLIDQQLLDTGSFFQDVEQLGATLFSLRHCSVFLKTTEGFSSNTNNITSPKSIITRAANTKSMVTSAEISTIVVDQQMLEETGDKILIALPLIESDKVIGVLVGGCEQPPYASELEDLQIFLRAICDALSRQGNERTISVNEIQRKAREISHEVNNPLAVAQNYLKILSLKLGGEHDAQSSITTISNEIQRAAELVKQYTHLGETSSQESSATDCNALLQDLLGVFTDSYPSISFSTNLDQSPAIITLSSARLKQVVVNLLKNAVEAITKQGKDSGGEILVQSRANIHFPDQSYVELEISDTGPGISTNLQEQLFSSGITTKPDQHTGLGLSIVKEIISAAGGSISFRTSETGTNFKLLLPQTNLPLLNAEHEESR